MGLLSGIRRDRRGRILWILGIYALLLAVNPVLHDDLACHLKTPTHCSACTATPSASRVECIGPMLPTLAEVGPVELADWAAGYAAPRFILAGRSPPA